MNTFLRETIKWELIIKGSIGTNMTKYLYQYKEKKIRDSNGAIRLVKMIQEGFQKSRDKKLLQNWAGSHARKAGLVASPPFGS